MIAWISNEKNYFKINYRRLKNNINVLKKEKDNEYFQYVINLFDEYDLFLKKSINNSKLVFGNLITKYKNEIIDCSDDINLVRTCNLVLSSGHDSTYHVLKALNNKKDKKVLVICIDMHLDAYDYNDELWKGNPFSKLIKENYIKDFLTIGVPECKVKNSLADVPKDIKEHVKIINENEIEKNIKKINPTNIFISIDIDCLNTRKYKITATDYSPASILYNISSIELCKQNSDIMLKQILDCIYIKNSLGYANLYRVGENEMNFNKIKNIISITRKSCDKYGINLGFNYKNHIIGDITEISGYDYGGFTSKIIVKLINELI